MELVDNFWILFLKLGYSYGGIDFFGMDSNILDGYIPFSCVMFFFSI